jgi:hypothetical protein
VVVAPLTPLTFVANLYLVLGTVINQFSINQ